MCLAFELLRLDGRDYGLGFGRQGSEVSGLGVCGFKVVWVLQLCRVSAASRAFGLRFVSLLKRFWDPQDITITTVSVVLVKPQCENRSFSRLSLGPKKGALQSSLLVSYVWDCTVAANLDYKASYTLSTEHTFLGIQLRVD